MREYICIGEGKLGTTRIHLQKDLGSVLLPALCLSGTKTMRKKKLSYC